jgi:hypothetical protein
MPIPITTLQKGNFSGIEEPLQTVVRNPEEWTALWQLHTSIQSPPTPLPAVDFSVEMIVGLFPGEKRTGCYEINITSAGQIDSTLFIYYVEKAPPPGGFAIQAITQPYHLVKLPKSDMPIVFAHVSP